MVQSACSLWMKDRAAFQAGSPSGELGLKPGGLGCNPGSYALLKAALCGDCSSRCSLQVGIRRAESTPMRSS